MKIERVSIVVPAYNESAMRSHLASTLGRLQSLLAEEGYLPTFILVDDGSQDDTAAMLEELASGLVSAVVLRHETNRGVGAAMRTGFEEANGEAIVCYDADCVYPPEDVLRLLEELPEAEVVTATPFAAEGELSGRVPWGRRCLSRLASLLYRLVLGRAARGVTTYTCAFRAYRTTLFHNVRFRANGFLAAAEILVRACLDGARVIEVPSRLGERPAGVSKMKVVRTAGAHLGLLARIAGERLLGRHRARSRL